MEKGSQALDAKNPQSYGQSTPAFADHCSNKSNILKEAQRVMLWENENMAWTQDTEDSEKQSVLQ